MIELGKSLRAAREAKGFTIGQLAEMTRMAPTTIQDLEVENFSRIAAPIYGRGFVKLYCEAVGLEPKPYVDEFMEIFNGNRQPEIRERPLPNETTVTETTIAETTVADEEPEVIAAEPPPRVQPLVPPSTPDPEPDLFNRPLPEEPAQEPTLSRYAAPIRDSRPAVDLQAIFRLGTLAIGALSLLALLIWGIRSVYRATTRTSEDVAVSAAPAPAKPAPAPAKPAPAPAKPATAESKAARTPQKVPSLYID